MTREELEQMDKSAIIDNYMKLQKDNELHESLEKYNREERERLCKILDAIMLIFNNYKK